MIRDWQMHTRNDDVIIGVALEYAIMDIVANRESIRRGIALLSIRTTKERYDTIGSFGVYSVTLNVADGDEVSLFVDGPEFCPGRSQSAAIWVGRDELLAILRKVLEQWLGEVHSGNVE